MSCKLLQFLCLLLITVEVSTGQTTDKEVLIQLKHFLQENNAIYTGVYTQWNELEASACRWQGIGCNKSGRVTHIDLSNNNISGPAFANFSRLAELIHLDLSANTITHTLPQDLNDCENLRHLNLSHNLLSGELNVSGLTNLRVLDVSLNRFQGNIGINFPAICANLVVLNVSTNNLTSDIIEILVNCSKLKYVDVSDNQFTGAISSYISGLTKLCAADNNLTGIIPASTFSLTCSLQALDLSGNNYSGNFPDSIKNCKNLTLLSLWRNQFFGPLPAGIGELAGLQQLFLGSNRFDRKIPESLLKCNNLEFLEISKNGFRGEVQEIFGQLESLKYLVLHSNGYVAGINSSGVLRLPKLERLDLSSNNFSGDLPIEISSMRNLKYFMLADNNFSGDIPAEYGYIAGLQALDLSYNQLSGQIPATIGNLTSLLWLMLAGNQLSGNIPPELGNCSSLLWLNLAGNQLSGKIPLELSKSGSDPFPTFAANRKDPDAVAGSGECQAMRRWIPANYPPFSFVYSVMTPRSCRVVWSRILRGCGIVPICSNSSSPVRTLAISGYVILSGNSLSGEIPPEIGGMQNISLLHLNDNRFSGSLPPEIGRLPLVVLNVSGNNFSSEIPSSIGDIRCLEILDMSRNNFSGEFPVSLGRLTELNNFNVSYNPLLSGQVPTTGQLATFDETSFLGDPHLLIIGQPPPATHNATVVVFHRQGMLLRTVAFWVFLAFTIAFLTGGAIACVFCLRVRSPVDTEPHPKVFIFDNIKCKSTNATSSPSTSSSAGYSSPSDGVRVFRLDQTKFTYRDIVAATGNFSDDLVVGRGGFGVVYRGVLPDGRKVAIKKLARLGEGEGDGEREFQAEMEVLANRNTFGWPHPNLVTLYGWCLSGASKLLVYEYLEGGSLEDVIANWEEFAWHRRLETIVCVARALTFLHHECQPAVVHRDVKASNVLLDREGRAKVTDFGLARVVEPGDSHVSTMVAGTIGYVAPEYSQTWRATTKGDVYSYGVLVMELATGRKAVDGGEECLVEWARRMDRDGWNVVEQKGQEKSLLLRLLMLGMRCTAELPQDRPDMREVLATLLKIIGNTINYRDDRDIHYSL